jgi:calcineurin-like phosphoesterase family protein
VANIFFISDTHFGHAGILSFKKEDGSPLRHFASVQEMDQHIIDRWNSVVRPQDHVYHLGDVAMKKSCLETISRCNGHLRLVRGNHDIFRTKDYLKFFDEIYGVRVLDSMIFTHIPIHPESLGRFKANVHGHTHGSLPGKFGEKYNNVSVEAVNYLPISLEDLKLRLSE